MFGENENIINLNIHWLLEDLRALRALLAAAIFANFIFLPRPEYSLSLTLSVTRNLRLFITGSDLLQKKLIEK